QAGGKRNQRQAGTRPHTLAILPALIAKRSRIPLIFGPVLSSLASFIRKRASYIRQSWAREARFRDTGPLGSTSRRPNAGKHDCRQTHRRTANRTCTEAGK